MSRHHGQALRVRLCACLWLSVGTAAPALADGAGGWFRTAEQRAAARWAEGEHEALAAEAPDARWEALGRYGAGDHEGAADAFARALGAGDERSASERDALRFGQATAATRAGRLEEALSLYDDLLAADPDDADARHNRDIARALQALEERETPPQGGGPDPSAKSSPGEGGEDAASGQEGQEAQDGQEARDGQEGGNEGEGDADRQAGGDGEERREAGESDSANAGEDGAPEAGEASADGSRSAGRDRGEGDPSGRDVSPSGATDAERLERAAREAREALAAEAERRERDDGSAGERNAEESGEEASGAVARGGEAPSEGEQATEQWLRRIPDDPAGLLRARLLQTHRDDYPEVGDGDEPW